MLSLSQLENQVFANGQLLPDDIAELARQGVKTIVNNRPDGEEAGQPTSDAVAKLAAEHGIEYHYIPVGRDPLTMEQVDKMAGVLKDAPRPIVAYCRSGMRSSTIFSYAKARLLEQR